MLGAAFEIAFGIWVKKLPLFALMCLGGGVFLGTEGVLWAVAIALMALAVLTLSIYLRV